jgi:hypothetical protein
MEHSLHTRAGREVHHGPRPSSLDRRHLNDCGSELQVVTLPFIVGQNNWSAIRLRDARCGKKEHRQEPPHNASCEPLDDTAKVPSVYGGTEKFQNDPLWRDHILFYEYFHGDNGAGLGASHQTGWTGLVAKLIQLYGLLDAKRVLEGVSRPRSLAAPAPRPREHSISVVFEQVAQPSRANLAKSEVRFFQRVLQPRVPGRSSW